ncbi:MAG: HD domain-containing protein [Ruminococcaceae bacterium]|nr:HD domain-containing protein [Oscillospiraceae bacterium]
MCKSITTAALDSLRACVGKSMSQYRFSHTLGVEQAVAVLAALYLPESAVELRAAALLHDITKEWPQNRAEAFMRAHAIALRPDEAASPKIWHGITAPLVIAAEFSAFATPTVLSAVRWHTTGHADMTLPEALLYLADYIEPGRTFADCVALRRAFFEAEPEKMDMTARLRHLWQILLLSFDDTLAALAAEGAPTCADTLAARSFAAKMIFPRKEA